MTSTTDPASAPGMTGEPQSPPSDNDGGERPVRKQLKETSIESVPATYKSGSHRKRSFEDSRDEHNSLGDNDENGESRRKRSRDCTPLDDTEVTTSLDTGASAKSENVSAITPMDSPLATPLDTAEEHTSPGPNTGLLEHESSSNSPAPKSPTPSNDCTWKRTSWVPYDDSVIPDIWLELLKKKKKLEPISDGSDCESDEPSDFSEVNPEILPCSEYKQSEDETHEPINSPVYSPGYHISQWNAATETPSRAQSAPLESSPICFESGSRSQSLPPFESNRSFVYGSHPEWLPPPQYFELDDYDSPSETVHPPAELDSNSVPWIPPECFDIDHSTRPENIRTEHPDLVETKDEDLCSESAHPPSQYDNNLEPVPRSVWVPPFELRTPSPSFPYCQCNDADYPEISGIYEELEAKCEPQLEEFDEVQPLSHSENHELEDSNQHEEPSQSAESNEPGNSGSQEPVQPPLEAPPKCPNDQDSDESELEIFPPDPSDHDDSIILNLECDDLAPTASEEPTAHFSSDKELSSPKPPTLTETDKGDNENDDTNTKLQDPKRSTTTETPSSTVDDESSKVLNKKRSREQLEDAGSKNDTKNDTVQDPTSTNPTGATSTTDGEREKKRHRDNSQERETKTDNAFAASAFGKAAGASPFASLGSNKDSADKPASTSAFASSSLAAFAGSENSPFGSLGASTPSVFKPATSGTSGFASPSTTSGFGSIGSGFSGVGGGFAAAAKPGGLTSFASSNAPATLGGTKAKAFGAEDSEGDDSDNGDDEEGTSTFEAAKTDERFYEQTIETGEEEEVTLFSCKAKLFGFVNKEWKERGIGTFKLNARKVDDGYANGRMIMRADGAMRVMLNSPIFEGMNYGDTDNNAPSTKQILLTGTEEGRRVPMLLRTGSEALAQELHEHIKGLLKKSD